MKTIDQFLNRITMYRLTLYVLIAYIVSAIGLSVLGFITYNPLDIAIQAGTAIIACYIFNFLFSKFFRAVTNTESVFITALILVCIFPLKVPVNTPLLVLASFAAMGAKYLLTIEKRHIFNPAAWAAVSVALITNQSATWWIGTPAMLPVVFIGGLLILRKVQRGMMVMQFLIAYLLAVAVGAFFNNGSLSAVFSTWQVVTLHTALFFFAFIMVTEPLTSPATKNFRKYYAWMTAVLSATPQLRLFGFALTPEMALCAANVYAYIVSPKYRLSLPLEKLQNLGGNVYSFIFQKPKNFTFIPGQYMEWTLPHPHTDSRGNRRYFSLASSPTEENIEIAVKYYEPPSSYKKALVAMQPGDKIIAASMAGDFVLPNDQKTPLVLVAGGIGVAPFRSMVQYVLDKNLQVDMVILYANRTQEEMAYADIFERAKGNGVRTVSILTDEKNIPADWTGERGHISPQMVEKVIPDWKKRMFYISGPQLMVQTIEQMLAGAGLPKSQLKTDFFPGY